MSPRRYPERPRLGVGAILLTPDLEKVLLVQRGHPPSEGRWTFPGGLVNIGETARLACLREVLEETGLHARVRDLATVAERVVRDADGRVEYHYLILDFWGVMEELEPVPSSDARDARWVPVQEVGALPLTPGVDRAVARALRLARGETPGSVLDE